MASRLLQGDLLHPVDRVTYGDRAPLEELLKSARGLQEDINYANTVVDGRKI